MREIPNYPDYFATRDGNIWSAKHSGKWLSPWVNRDGYQVIRLIRDDGIRVGTTVARVMAITYLGLEVDSPNQVDHINRKRADDRLENLRIVTAQENHFNQTPWRAGTSRYLGVYWGQKKWRAQIRHNGKAFYLGSFSCEIDAAKRYDKEALRLRPAHANLNFPVTGCVSGRDG